MVFGFGLETFIYFGLGLVLGFTLFGLGLIILWLLGVGL